MDSGNNPPPTTHPEPEQAKSAEPGEPQHDNTKGFCNLPALRSKTGRQLKPVRTPVAIFGSLGVCIYVPASRHWLISYSPIHLT